MQYFHRAFLYAEECHTALLGIRYADLCSPPVHRDTSISHRGYVLELGRNRLTGTGQELLDNDEVRQLYLGGKEEERV